MQRRVLTLFFVLLASCGDSSEPGAVRASGDRSFEPDRIEVSVGDTVTWTVDGSQVHTVTAYEEDLPEGATYFASGGFSSEKDARSDVAGGLLRDRETFEVTFDEPGTYRYFCIPHESDGMTGTVIVGD